MCSINSILLECDELLVMSNLQGLIITNTFAESRLLFRMDGWDIADQVPFLRTITAIQIICS